MANNDLWKNVSILLYGLEVCPLTKTDYRIAYTFTGIIRLRVFSYQFMANKDY